MGDQIAGAMINYQGVQDPRGNQGSIGRFTFAPPARAGGRWDGEKAEFVPQWFDVGTGRVVDLNAASHRGRGRAPPPYATASGTSCSAGARRQDGLVMGR